MPHMAKKASVVIETEESVEDDVEDDMMEDFVKRLWEVRFQSVGYEHDYEIRVESIEEK